jgi:hypothetical protein
MCSHRCDHVTRGLPDLGKSFTLLVCVCFLTSRLTSNSFEGHSCCIQLQRLVRRMPFATSPAFKQHWLPNRRLSTRTVRNRLKSGGRKSKRVIKHVFSHQSAYYSIVVAHLTSNSFAGHPCCMHADYFPSLGFWYSPSYGTMLTKNE